MFLPYWKSFHIIRSIELTTYHSVSHHSYQDLPQRVSSLISRLTTACLITHIKTYHSVSHHSYQDLPQRVSSLISRLTTACLITHIKTYHSVSHHSYQDLPQRVSSLISRLTTACLITHIKTVHVGVTNHMETYTLAVVTSMWALGVARGEIWKITPRITFIGCAAAVALIRSTTMPRIWLGLQHQMPHRYHPLYSHKVQWDVIRWQGALGALLREMVQLNTL